MPEFTFTLETPESTIADEDQYDHADQALGAFHETINANAELLGPSAMIHHPTGVLSSRFQVITDTYDAAETTAIDGFRSALRAASLPDCYTITEIVAEDLGPTEFDTYIADHGLGEADLPAAFAQWLANKAGKPIIGGPADQPPEFVAVPDQE